MLEVKDFLVRTFDLDYIDMWWTIADTVEDHLNYSFTLFRSESPEGPWDQIAGPFKDKWYFRDTTVNQNTQHFNTLDLTHTKLQPSRHFFVLNKI